MSRFSTAREAKEFLASKIVEQAELENSPLSEIERKMLYFSERGWTLPDIMEVNAEFEREYDATKYEKRIAHLIHDVTTRLRRQKGDEYASWLSAIRKLRTEDHYLCVMIN